MKNLHHRLVEENNQTPVISNLLKNDLSHNQNITSLLFLPQPKTYTSERNPYDIIDGVYRQKDGMKLIYLPAEGEARQGQVWKNEETLTLGE